MKASLQVRGVPDANRMRRAFTRVLHGLTVEAVKADSATTLNKLKPPPNVARPIQWTSVKQRIAVMIKYREQGITHYTRTGATYARWKYYVAQTPQGGAVILTNPSPIAKYLYGSFQSSKRPQQRMHVNSGYAAAYDVRREAFTAVMAYIEPRYLETLVSFGKVENSRI